MSVHEHRRAVSEDYEVIPLKPPFSFFDFAEARFPNCLSIRRLLSLARAANAETLVLERIHPCGIISEENEDILAELPSYTPGDLFRLSFWKKTFSADGVAQCVDEDLIGYGILKHDVVPAEKINRWHTFEAVFVKYPHRHNCVPRPQTYQITVGNYPFEIAGLLYCQQNSLNKACAQVALRSILSRLLPEGDISYRQINTLAEKAKPGFIKKDGLSVRQMREVFDNYKIKYSDVDYENNPASRSILPYQKYAYAGLESGGGALLGFRLSGGAAKHIIPIYGHTFNKDTWVPDADMFYFSIGEGVRYIPSESWTSSFLGHDDNFGPNFCIPRLYIDNSNVDYVVEFFRPGISYSGVQAEAVSLNILYSILPSLSSFTNKWIRRLEDSVSSQQVVFRAQAMTKSEYVDYLDALRDWNGNREDRNILLLLKQEMPEHVWAVEISTPQLFPANERKLGEIVLDATKVLNTSSGSSGDDVFNFARLPGIYFFGGDSANGFPQFNKVPSQLETHTSVISF